MVTLFISYVIIYISRVILSITCVIIQYYFICLHISNVCLGKYPPLIRCITYNQSLKVLLEQDLITLEDALNAADSPDELKLELRGISKDAHRSIGASRGRR